MVGRKMLGRLRAYVGTWAQASVDQTGTMANFFDVRHNPMTVTPGYVMHPDQRAVSLIYEREREIVGFKSVAIDALACDLCGTGEELNAASGGATKTAQSKVLEAVLGGYLASTGSTVEASPAPTAGGFTVAAGHGARFGAGHMIWVETTATSERFEPAVVASVATDALTLDAELSFTPAAGAKVLSSQQVYPTNQPTSVLQLLCEEEDRDGIYLLLGAQASGIELNWPMGEAPSYSLPMMAASWLHDDDIATPQGGSALAVATIDGGQRLIVKAGAARRGTIGSAAMTDVSGIYSVTFRPNLQRVQVPDISDLSGLNGVGGYEVTRGSPPELIIERTFDAETTLVDTLPDDSTLHRWIFQAGNVAGKQGALAISRAQLVNVEQIETNGLHALRETYHLQLGSYTDQTTDLRRWPWALSCG